MAGWKRRILGITVIAGGVCAALPFRNDSPQVTDDSREAAKIARSSAAGTELTLQLTIPIGSEPVESAARQPDVAPAVLKQVSSAQPQEVRQDDLQVPPQLASSFESFAGTVPVAVEATEPLSKRDEPERRHRIADGDTLETIAERYLGKRSEWRSIYAHNDGVLTDPAVLPIGKEIKIPAAAASASEDDHLVPIPAGLLNRD